MENLPETPSSLSPKETEEKKFEPQESIITEVKPLNKILSVLREIILPESEREAEHVFVDELAKRQIRVEPISGKRGFKIYLVEVDDKRYAVWLRAKPVSREALEMAEKILKNYEIDGKILVKLVRKADYTKVLKWIKVSP